VLLSNVGASEAPVCRVLPWFPNDAVQSMCFDPSLSWLLCCAASGKMYIVPAAPIMVGSAINFESFNGTQ
jgi:hypothetical protein